jgi:hypothetical protein
LITPFLEIGFAHRRQDPAPSCLERCASLFECGRGTAPIVAGLHARIETAAPFPLLDVDRAARSASDRADMGVTVVDVPAVRALGIAARAGMAHHFADRAGREAARDGGRPGAPRHSGRKDKTLGGALVAMRTKLGSGVDRQPEPAAIGDGSTVVRTPL